MRAILSLTDWLWASSWYRSSLCTARSMGCGSARKKRHTRICYKPLFRCCAACSFSELPTAYAVGFILTPLRGYRNKQLHGSAILFSDVRRCRSLEIEFQRYLHEPRSCRAHHLSERGAVDIPIDGRGSIELGMIEDVERLHAKFQRLRFG